MSKFLRKIGKASKHSYNVVIPKEIVEKYKWKDKQKLVVEDKGNGRVELRDWKRK